MFCDYFGSCLMNEWYYRCKTENNEQLRWDIIGIKKKEIVSPFKIKFLYDQKEIIKCNWPNEESSYNVMIVLHNLKQILMLN